jgi:hypothetical protein
VQVLRRGAFGRMPNEACWAKDGPSCRPSERHRNERSETRMSGALSLWLLSLLREQRESNSPRGETNKPGR